jgi:hypothetical protein
MGHTAPCAPHGASWPRTVRLPRRRKLVYRTGCSGGCKASVGCKQPCSGDGHSGKSERAQQHASTLCFQRAICYARPPACTCQKASGLRVPAGTRSERTIPRHAQAGTGARCYVLVAGTVVGVMEREDAPAHCVLPASHLLCAPTRLHMPEAKRAGSASWHSRWACILPPCTGGRGCKMLCAVAASRERIKGREQEVPVGMVAERKRKNDR